MPLKAMMRAFSCKRKAAFLVWRCSGEIALSTELHSGCTWFSPYLAFYGDLLLYCVNKHDAVQIRAILNMPTIIGEFVRRVECMAVVSFSCVASSAVSSEVRLSLVAGVRTISLLGSLTDRRRKEQHCRN